MIHLSDPAAYHDKRFKNNPTKRKTMKTPMPEPEGRMYDEDCGEDLLTGQFTESQLKAAMVAAYREGVEDAAKVCDEQAAYERADKCAEEIRKLKE